MWILQSALTTLILFSAFIQNSTAQSFPAPFNGVYLQNFDSALTNYATAMPPGFRMLILPGNNGTYTATNPISTGAIASATPASPQNLIAWDSGNAVTDSGTALFNIGSVSNLNDRALGSDPSGVAAVVIELSLTNTTGIVLSGLTFSYDLKVLTNGTTGTEAGELPGYSFFYSLTGGANSTEWTGVSALSLTNYIQGTTTNSGIITLIFATPLASNGVIYFRWADDNCESISPDQMIAIDNIAVGTLTNNPPNQPVVVSPLPNAINVTNHPVLSVSVYDTNANKLIVNFYGRVAGTGSFAQVGTASGALSGINASCRWYGLAANTTFEWFATVSDGVYTVTNSISQFTTTASFPSIPPTITLTNPTNIFTFSAPTNLILSANAADADGIVTNVSFYQGATKIADVAASPYNYTWSGIPAGVYSITAVATDDDGLTATSTVATVTLTNSLAVQVLQQIKTVFVIGMENHNFTQPNPGAGPQQIVGNPAAPYLNSLITAGNSNAVQVSYSAKYYGTAMNLHPSEPNYIWAEAGTDFGVEIDVEPSLVAGNVFDAPHLTRQFNTAGISWKNYQEDVQFSTDPLHNGIGTSTNSTNFFYGNGQYSYAGRHNPMAFFTDTQFQNVYPLANLFSDLTNNATARYNWITPNLFNDQHTPLSGGFMYHGVGYANDQAAVAQGDNFLATLIPMIMASTAYQDHGLIIIRWDETEGGDGENITIPEIIISPMAKGNAYASSVEMNHSSDVKTMGEIFGLMLLTNAIPAREVNASGSGHNDVSTVNDLSDLFLGTSPPPPVPTNYPPPVFFGRMMPGGGFQLTFPGTQGQNYRVLASDNPNIPESQWSVVGGGTFGATNATYTDFNTANHRNRFYIVKSP